METTRIRILAGWSLVFLISLVPGDQSFAQPDSSVPVTQIVLLGTGTPNADPDRSGPSLAIVVRGTPYIVDFGPGLVRQAAKAHRSGIAGLEVSRLGHAFLTHLHSDHTVGYPDLIITPWVLDRYTPLQVFGPPGIREMTDHVLAAYEQDIRMRIDGLEPANETGYRVDVHEVAAGIVYEDSNVTVEAFDVSHGSWDYAFGYKFTTPDQTIVVSGDTAPSENLIEMARGCDVLIHEVYSQKGFEGRSPVWQKYHSGSHTSSIELAEIAQKTRPGLLILHHQLFWGSSEEELLKEITDRYDGPVVSGHDLDVF